MTEVSTAGVETAAVAKKNDPARQPVHGVDGELVDRLVGQACAAGLQLTGDGGFATAAHEAGPGVRLGLGDQRPPRL
jgi:hypothetical protein